MSIKPYGYMWAGIFIPANGSQPWHRKDGIALYAIPDTHRVVTADSLAVDAEIIKALTGALSELVLECMGGGAPSNRALMRARASLPAGVAGSVCK